MNVRNMSPVMKFHLGLSVALVVASLLGAILFLIGIGYDISDASAPVRHAAHLYALIQLINAVALGCSIIYLSSGYSKRAAIYYRYFLILLITVSLLHMITAGFVGAGNVGGPLVAFSQIIVAARIFVLCMLTFVPDLGKRNSWILFGLLVAFDLAYVLFFGSDGGIVVYRLFSTLSKLALDGTIGLAIRGKYADKAARGTR